MRRRPEGLHHGLLALVLASLAVLGCRVSAAISAPADGVSDQRVAEPTTTAEAPVVVAAAAEPNTDADATNTGSDYGRSVRSGLNLSKPTIEGELDSDIIRRIVRAHVNELRSCYNEGLKRDPALAGRFSIDFVIDRNGDVVSATSTDGVNFGDPAVPDCAVAAVAGWTFPKPTDGGEVRVSYPFNLNPG